MWAVLFGTAFLFPENLRPSRRFQVALAMNRLKRGNSFAEDGGAINQLHQDQQRSFKMDEQSLSHTTWNCKYHIVFAPKYRRKVFFGEKRVAIGKILRQLCEWKGVNIIEAEVCPDHVHMLVEIPPKMSVSSFMGYLKGKSATMIYEQFGELKYKYRNREFWCKGYYVDTVGKNKSRIAEYIKHQLDEDKLGDQLSIAEVNQFGKKKK